MAGAPGPSGGTPAVLRNVSLIGPGTDLETWCKGHHLKEGTIHRGLYEGGGGRRDKNRGGCEKPETGVHVVSEGLV